MQGIAKKMIRPVFEPDRLISKVWLEGNEKPWLRFVELIYDRWPVDSVNEFEEKLGRVVPKGTRWYGGFVNVFRDSRDTGMNGKQKCIYTLLDFAGVEEETTLSYDCARFTVNGVAAEAGESCMHGDKDGDLQGAPNENVLGGYYMERLIDNTIVSNRYFGDYLVEDTDDSTCKRKS